jgi:amino acid adenylation domain-containing protein
VLWKHGRQKASTRLGFRWTRTLRTMHHGPVQNSPGAAPAIGASYPLSFAQERIWFLDQLQRARPAYLIPVALRIRGALDVDALHTAITSVAARQEILRTAIAVIDGVPRQYVCGSSPSFELVDLTSLPHGEREASAWKRISSDLTRGFALTEGSCLARSTLLRITDVHYILVVVLHHIVADGQSVSILVDDLFSAYAATTSGARVPPRPLRPNYLMLAQQERADVELSAAPDLAYWVERLSDAPRSLSLPADLRRPRTATFGGVTANAVLSPLLLKAVDLQAKRCGATRFMVISAAFHAFLSRYTGETDLVIGYPVSTRTTAVAQHLIGLFANTLVQRTDMRSDPSFTELVHAVKADTLAGMAHAGLRLEQLIGAICPDRELDRHPVFQAFVNSSPGPWRTRIATGLTIEPILLENGSARFDVELSLQARAHATDAIFRCNADIFEQATAQQMINHFRNLLDCAAQQPDRQISRLALLTRADREQILVGFNDTHRPSRADAAAHTAFMHQARTRPQAIAVTSGEATYTYHELDARSTSLAYALLDAGLHGNAVVAVCIERSLELAIALLGVLKAGAIYMPIDPSGPQARLAYALSDARPEAIIALSTISTRLPYSADVPFIPIDKLPVPGVATRRPPPHLSPVDPANAAYLMYTSGSTGQPNAVVVGHRALANRLTWMQTEYALSEDDVVLQKTPVGFDVSLWELLWPLSVGARLVVAPPGAERDPDRLTAIVRKERVTTIHFVPSLLKALVDGGALPVLGDVRRVLCSGEELPCSLRDDVIRTLGPKLHNLYGPTEAAIDVTSHHCDPARDGVSVPIGTPIFNVCVYILDRHLRPVPIGVPGELCIGGGVALAFGYRGRPRLTAERFVPNPFEYGTRLYRTGDTARFGRAGVIEFLGRNDSQVKIRGHRVELGEIEETLRALPSVVDAAAVFRSDEHGGGITVYYVQSSASVRPRDLREMLSRELPTYAIPDGLIRLDHLPVGPTGKLARDALPAPAQDDTPQQDTAVPPSTPLERVLASAWRHAMGGDPPVSIDANFFTHGGNSIRSIALVTHVRATGLSLTVHDVFECKTIRRMAHRINQRPEVSVKPPIAPFALMKPDDIAKLPADIVDAWPLPRLLHALTIESEKGGLYRIYTTSLLLTLSLDVEALRTALTTVLSQHSFLRSSVVMDQFAEPLQVVHAHVQSHIGVHDWRDSLSPRQLFTRWLKVERETPFHWGRPPLLRLTVHRFTDTTFFLTLSEPYLDGWSAALVLTTLLETYVAVTTGRTTASRGSSMPYSEFVAREQSALESSQTRLFWLDTLSDATRSTIPLLRKHYSDAERDHIRIDVPLPKSASGSLAQLANQLAMPLKTVLLAAHMRVAALLAGTTDVITGLMANARPEDVACSTDAVGLFLNLTPLRVQMRGGTWLDLIREVHDAEAATLPHRSYPHAQIMHDLRADRLFDTAFNFTHFNLYSALSQKGCAIADICAFDQTYVPLTAHFKIGLDSETLTLALEFDTTGMAAVQFDRIAHYYLVALAALSTSPHTRYDTMTFLDRHERRAIERHNGSSVDLGRTTSLSQIFERQVETTPRGIAVLDLEEVFTYSGVNSEANRLARFLLRQGARPGMSIAVHMPRSLAFVVATLAIEKMGAIFVPMDCDHPVERLRILCHDARVKFIIARSPAPAHSHLEVPILYVDVLADRIARELPSDLALRIGPDAPAHIIYTSGSTGSPKAVVTSHRAVINRLQWMWLAFPFAADEIVALRTSPAFVDSVAELHSGLLRGVPTAIIPQTVEDPAALIDMLARYRATRVTIVPSLARLLIDSSEDLGSILSLKYIILSGEPTSVGLVQALERAVPSAVILNLYGTTEVAGDATFARVTSHDNATAVPVGGAIASTGVQVLDPWGMPAPLGVAGELTISGEGLALGYLNDSRLTAEHFIPFGAGLGKRMYRTGDLARRRHDGALEIVGRVDRALNVNGVRSHPAEIEAALLAHPAVTAAVVTTELIAHVEADPSRTTPADIRRCAKQTLPQPLIPRSIVIHPKLPRGPAGKIDYRALPRALSTDAGGPRRIQPRTPLEDELARLLAASLRIDHVGALDDFFELGGNSLHAMMLVGAVRKRLGIPLHVADIFDHPTVQGLASHLSESWSPNGH